MIDQNTADSGLQSGVTDANQNTSGGAGVQPNSQPVEQVPAWAKELQASVRALQSGKDRSNDRTSKRLDEYAPILEAVKAKMESEGMTFDQAQKSAVRDYQIDQLISGNQQQSSAPVSQGSGTDDAVTNGGIALSLLNKLGLTSNDPEVSKVLMQHQSDPAELSIALVGLSANRKNQSPPSAASIAFTAPGSPAKNVDDLYVELEGLSKNISQNRPRYDAIVSQLRAAGETI